MGVYGIVAYLVARGVIDLQGFGRRKRLRRTISAIHISARFTAPLRNSHVAANLPLAGRQDRGATRVYWPLRAISLDLPEH